MSYKIENTQQAVISQYYTSAKYLFAVLIAGVMLTMVSCSDPDTTNVKLVIDPALGQAVFDTADNAASTLVQAVESQDVERLGQMLGDDYRQVLPLDEVDSEDVDNFLAAWEQSHAMLPEGDNKMLLALGDNKWTLPIPIVAGESGWYFDTEEGLERILIRRIGRNELATMQAVLAYYDAQMEYAEQDRNDNGKLEYAQQFLSTPGAHDGLYWEVQPGETPSPLGPLMADQTSGSGYHGYFYRILNAQGEHARGGAYSYLMGDQMRSGFALIAWPVEYGESGVMSFLVSHAGIVYEQNLGPDGASIAKAMKTYDPGPEWTPVKEMNSPQAGDKE